MTEADELKAMLLTFLRAARTPEEAEALFYQWAGAKRVSIDLKEKIGQRLYEAKAMGL